MNYNDFLQNKSFLIEMDKNRLKETFLKILILDKNENVEFSIQGIAQTGNISINGKSSVRRVGNLTLLVENKEDDFNNIDTYLQLNKKISIEIGDKNYIDNSFDDIIWHPQGVFIITSVSISNSLEGIQINLGIEDKMGLLNGDCGGELPSSITFHEFIQVNEDGTQDVFPQKMFDIIQSLMVCYANENLSNIIINDIPLELKNIVRYTGEGQLFYNALSGVFTKDENAITQNGEWFSFEPNENVGYIYTDFTYPGELRTGLGDTICSVLEKTTEVLENYEFFYDVNGHFVYQEKKNYLNTSYQNTVIKTDNNNLSIINNENYNVDFSGDNKSIYDFTDKKDLIVSISTNPDLSNIRNDFHIWGKKEKNSEDLAIHYHLVIKEKPYIMNSYSVIFNEDGETIRLATEKDSFDKIVTYIPSDWRAELYLQGLECIKKQQRPDIYQQEILDNFDSIYNFQKKDFKIDIIKHPTKLNYFIDYLDPNDTIGKYSVDTIGSKVLTIQKDEINAIFELDTPNLVLINIDDTENYESTVLKCESTGQPYSNVRQNVYENISLGSCINTAQSFARELLSTHTTFNETISITCIPIRYLDVNNRITINDKDSGVFGDYVIDSITQPLDSESCMTLQCSKVIERV